MSTLNCCLSILATRARQRRRLHSNWRRGGQQSLNLSHDGFEGYGKFGRFGEVFFYQVRRRLTTTTTTTTSGGTGTGSSTTTTESKMTNRLKDEKSPYLLQHQHNPVDWYSWNPATLAYAKAAGKPIFLSSGYSTCHWCHVMERESFENAGIAAIMNEHFVNIKLDREEHPDIDRIYMTFIQAMSGSGGWPMSVWLTPDLKPFYGGTYFPPEDRYYGRPGFKALLQSLAEQWGEQTTACLSSAEKIVGVLHKSATLAVSPNLPAKGEAEKKCLNQLARHYEPAYGGFSEQPKFPQPVNLQFINQHARSHGMDSFKMVDKTLRSMRKGGIYDHLAQGFCRYSTDKKWHVPHFEKMLYDQSQLASVYLAAFLVSKDPFFAGVTREVLAYVQRDMSVEDGGFYSAEDADSLPTPTSTHKKEGAFYVWEKSEIDEILKGLKVGSKEAKDLSELFCERYGVKAAGNVDPHQDPHDELLKKNILFEAKDVASLATEWALPSSEVTAHLDTAREKLLLWRNAHRPRPHLDNKFIASWNGLMVSAFAQAGLALGEESYLARAESGAEFIQSNFGPFPIAAEGATGGGGSRFLRTCYAGEGGVGVTNLASPISACVDDYSNVIGALLDLFQGTGKVKYLKRAREMQGRQDELFWDAKNGGYFTSEADPTTVIVRMKDDDDGAEPSSNSTSLVNLMRLSSIFPANSANSTTTTTDYGAKVEKILLQFSDRMDKVPITLPLMTSGLAEWERGGGKSVWVVGAGARQSALFQHLRGELVPTGGLLVGVDTAESGGAEELLEAVPWLKEKVAKGRSQGHAVGAEGEVTVIVRRGGKEVKVAKSLEELLD